MPAGTPDSFRPLVPMTTSWLLGLPPRADLLEWLATSVVSPLLRSKRHIRDAAGGLRKVGREGHVPYPEAVLELPAARQVREHELHLAELGAHRLDRGHCLAPQLFAARAGSVGFDFAEDGLDLGVEHRDQRVRSIPEPS
jgi:hypothetical protein